MYSLNKSKKQNPNVIVMMPIMYCCGAALLCVGMLGACSPFSSLEVKSTQNSATYGLAAPSVTSPSIGATVTSSSVDVIGACENYATVRISGDIVNSPRTVVCSENAYSLSVILTSGNGSKTLSISQIDRVGNVSAVTSLRLALSGEATARFVTVFDCNESNFVASTNRSPAPCAVDITGWNHPPNGFEIYGASGGEVSVESGRVYLSRALNNGGHLGTNMVYQHLVNVRAFEANFTFIPSGKNIAFVLQNATNSGMGFNGKNFNSGAGCEAGFFQGYDEKSAVNNIFALALMQDEALSNNAPYGTFNYSSTMIYKSGECPCNYMPVPDWATNTPFSVPTRLSTYPVPLNSPWSTPLTTTGQVYSAKINYDGSKVTLNLYNKTAGGSCPGANCFSYTWNDVNIPALVGGDTAWVSISAGCNSDCPRRVNVHSFIYAAPAISP